MLSTVSTLSGEINRSYAPQSNIGNEKDVKESDTSVSVKNSDADSRQFSVEEELSLSDQKVVQSLEARDQEVRIHEQAHLSAAGSFAIGGPSFTFTTGPDGNRYAIGGDVQVDVSAIPGDPVATIQKAEQIRRAAMAPANPSSQDKNVASKATAMLNQARLELLQQTQQADDPDAEDQKRLGTLLDITA